MRTLNLLCFLVVATLLIGTRSGQAADVTIPLPDGTVLRAKLFLPSGAARAAPIVALHGCGGPYPSRDRQWADLLTQAGHPVLFPDSFGSRGLGSQCGTRSRAVSADGARRQDALVSARWMAEQGFAGSGGVVLLGWSNGASTALAAGRAAPDLPRGLIRGSVLFYPGCGAAIRRGWSPAAPELILIGEADDWTPAESCRRYAATAPGRVTFVSYPGAFHDFDAPDRPVRTRRAAYSADGSGVVHQGTDPAARADALARVPAFIAALPPAP